MAKITALRLAENKKQQLQKNKKGKMTVLTKNYSTKSSSNYGQKNSNNNNNLKLPKLINTSNKNIEENSVINLKKQQK